MVKRDRKNRWLVLAAGWLFMSAGALHATGSFSLVYAVQTPADGGVIAVTDLGQAYVSGVYGRFDPLPWTPPPGAPAGPPYGPYLNSYMDGDAFIMGYDPAGRVIYRAFVPGPAVDYARELVASSQLLYVAREEFDTDGSWGDVLLLRRVVIDNPLYSAPVVNGHWATIQDLVVDSSGTAYVTGRTGSRTYLDYTNPNHSAAYVTKVDQAGVTHRIRELDGTGDEEGFLIDLDEQGFIYVAGTTTSPEFPVTSGSVTGGWFVVKLDPSGAIVYSIRLGGEIVEMNARNGGLDLILNGPSLVRLDGSGTLASTTNLADQGAASLVAAAFGPDNSVYLTGNGVAPGAPFADPQNPGCLDNFLAQVNLDTGGTSSICLPGVRIRGLAVDAAGDAFVTGDIVTVGLFPAEAIRKSFVARIAFNQPPDCTAAFASPATLWPPDGRLVPISIQGVTDPDGDAVTVTVTAVSQDEPLQGATNAVGIGTPGIQLRADRDGKGDGRVYRLSFTAADPSGGTCTGTVTVCVPHDQGRGKTCGDAPTV